MDHILWDSIGIKDMNMSMPKGEKKDGIFSLLGTRQSSGEEW